MEVPLFHLLILHPGPLNDTGSQIRPARGATLFSTAYTFSCYGRKVGGEGLYEAMTRARL